MASIKVTDATFDKEVLGAERPVFVDFWAQWCAPCRSVAPIIEELSEELKAHVIMAKLDVDESPLTSARLRVQSIPTFILFHKGKPLGSLQGAQPKARILKFLESHVPALKPPTISVKELDSLLQAGHPVHVFDIRDERDFTRSHVRGARCVAAESLDAELATIPPSDLVVLICRTGEKSQAEAVKRANQDGRVVALEKGLLEWQGSGKPTYSTQEEAELA